MLPDEIWTHTAGVKSLLLGVFLVQDGEKKKREKAGVCAYELDSTSNLIFSDAPPPFLSQLYFTTCHALHVFPEVL